MKLKQLHLQRFKRFEDYTLDFTFNDPDDPRHGEPQDLIVLVGDNGSGKSSILQAIAATIGTATGQLTSPDTLKWSGFEFDHISDSHHGFSKVTLEVIFDNDEIQATQSFFENSDFGVDANNEAIKPSDLNTVTLEMRNHPDAPYQVGSPDGRRAYFQFRGREYAFNMLRQGIRKPGLFDNIGGIKWFTDDRHGASVVPTSYDKSIVPDSLDSIRQTIANWDSRSATLGQQRLERLSELYSQLFPKRRFDRIGETFGGETPEVYFTDGHLHYEIGEFSGGERALFPFLLEFTRGVINNSIILIDELELHLHPPLQQRLIAMLSKLGNNNQFIITTHSDAVFDVVPSYAIRRIETETVAS